MHDDLIKWKHFLRGIHRWPVNSPFFDLRLNKRLTKQSRHRWFETPSHSLWRQCNVLRMDFACFSYTFIAEDRSQYLQKKHTFISPWHFALCLAFASIILTILRLFIIIFHWLALIRFEQYNCTNVSYSSMTSFLYDIALYVRYLGNASYRLDESFRTYAQSHSQNPTYAVQINTPRQTLGAGKQKIIYDSLQLGCQFFSRLSVNTVHTWWLGKVMCTHMENNDLLAY